MDVHTKRPRTPNTRYSELTEEQIKNIKHNPSTFFQCEFKPANVNGPPREGGRFYKDRYATNMSQHNVRPDLSHPYCYITERKDRNPDPLHNTARLGAFYRWGPQKTGERTMRHFSAEDKNDYLNIDVYRRQPTNEPRNIIMAYGRPDGDYYAQKTPSITTWFGASMPLNYKSKILQSIGQKTVAEYEAIRQAEIDHRTRRTGQWPEYSEHTDRFTLRTRTLPQLNSN